MFAACLVEFICHYSTMLGQYNIMMKCFSCMALINQTDNKSTSGFCELLMLQHPGETTEYILLLTPKRR